MSRNGKFTGSFVYMVGTLALALILGFAVVRDLWLGFTTGADVYFQMAQAYGGLAIAFLSFSFIEFDVKLHPKKFLAFQGLFVVGTALVLPYIQNGTPFGTTTSFEVGSFALIVTGFFIANVREQFHSILLYSITATTALFSAGMLSAFREVVGVASPSTGVGGATIYVTTSLFLIGAIDLTFLSVFLFRVVVDKIKRKDSPISENGSVKSKG